ncbi:GTPase [Anatilimnocola sp. NA78]|uniref:GTPase n=1 Tax=Anatilimnocola sp. NA78 TaxID=3415683 RepID=UPI003CE4D50F
MLAAEDPSTTFVAQLTPPGRGALATIALRGPNAHRFAKACLVEPITVADLAKRPWLRTFRTAHNAGEELVVAFPHEQEARLHCHGGAAACEAVLTALESQGAVCITWQEWATKTTTDAVAAAAAIALPAALTERAALILLDQFQGALSNEIEVIGDLLCSPKFIDEAIARLDDLLSRAAFGMHLTQPWRVVIAGKPNAGKSSLLNALLGFQRSIISELPGTTRDVVTARTAFEGWPVELRDTAGLRDSSDELEVAGVELARHEMATADLFLHVVAANESFTEDEHVSNSMLVRTKGDLVSRADQQTVIAGMLVSSVTRQGLPELMQAIAKRLVPRVPPARAAVPFTLQQTEQLQACREVIEHDSLQAKEILQAMLLD